jgi:hypothetical protein
MNMQHLLTLLTLLTLDMLSPCQAEAAISQGNIFKVALTKAKRTGNSIRWALLPGEEMG